jgi:4-amino-4-deoxychorismate lyase
MKAIYNNEILDWDELRLSQLNRGFRYGDGFFETIAVVNGIPRFLERHIDRLKNGAEKLMLDVQAFLQLDIIKKNIRDLQLQNELHENAKVKLTIWRDSEGIYDPVGGNTHYLLTIEPRIFKKISMIECAGISTETVNYFSPVSKFKTLSAMKYVVAGIEKNEKHLDEIIILDHRDYVSETLSSNIFWRKKNTYYTSPLSTGCIEGIMRNWLMENLKQKGYLMEEKLANTTELLASDHVFTTNAMGISHIQSIGQNKYEMDLAVQEIIESIS